MKIRKRLNEEQAKQLNLEIKPKEGNRSPRYTITQVQLDSLVTNSKEKQEKPFVLSAWNEVGYMMDIDEYCEHYKLPRHDIRSYKLVSHTGTPFYNILFKESVEAINEIDYSFINDIVKKHIKPVSSAGVLTEKQLTFDKVVFTDVHVGMTTNGSGNALYSKRWDYEELSFRCYEMCDYIKNRINSNVLVIDDLGDFLDGWNGETTRKGHHLPQNMTNKEMFDHGLQFKISMVDELINFYDEIIINNICNDNHAGDFGYVLNSAFKSIIELKYNNVKVTNHNKFINHYYIGKHCFVISHGKDSHALKFGFKVFLDSKQIEKIDQYLKHNDIYKKSEFIEFSKGDSHQMLFDYCTSDDFDYCNYGAFSPSSEWVQTNFKKGRS